MVLSLDERAELRALIGARFPQSDDATEEFFRRIEDAVLTYGLSAAFVESIAGSEREFEAGCRSVAKHAGALLGLLDADDAFQRLIALELLPTRLSRGRNPRGQAQYIGEQARIRKATLADIRESLNKLSAAASRGLAVSGNWGKNRGRGRPRGLSDVQVGLAVACCEALQTINVRPALSESKRERWVKDREAEYPALLRWALSKADRRTASGKLVVGDVNGIALEGLKLFEARP